MTTMSKEEMIKEIISFHSFYLSSVDAFYLDDLLDRVISLSYKEGIDDGMKIEKTIQSLLPMGNNGSIHKEKSLLYQDEKRGISPAFHARLTGITGETKGENINE